MDVLDLWLGQLGLLVGDWGLRNEFLGFDRVGVLLEGFLLIGKREHCE